jgi:hypothetical protein
MCFVSHKCKKSYHFSVGSIYYIRENCILVRFICCPGQFASYDFVNEMDYR